MKTFEFQTELERVLEKQPAGELQRWLRNFEDLQAEVTERLLSLAWHLDSMPNELKRPYVEALLSVLEFAPRDIRTGVSSTLRKKLSELADSMGEESERSRLQAALERHVTVA